MQSTLEYITYHISRSCEHHFVVAEHYTKVGHLGIRKSCMLGKQDLLTTHPCCYYVESVISRSDKVPAIDLHFS
jgi:hypothetical protein